MNVQKTSFRLIWMQGMMLSPMSFGVDLAPARTAQGALIVPC